MTKFPHFLVFGIFILVIFMTVFSSVSEAREKHALIIANKDYIHGGSLTNPIKDSKALAKTLRNAGFSVSIRENLSYTKMRTAISEFGLQHSATDNVALVYYSGHGAEFDGVNYLIPVDAKLDDARKARQEAMTLRDVQNFMYREISDEEKATGKNAKGLNIIVLDACRNNPYPARQKSRNRGLGKFEGASGTMIWYAAQPGAKANDGNNDDLSPFAASFVEAIDNSKGEAVEDTFKEVARLTLKKTKGVQEPWLSGNILGRFSFTPGRGRNTAYRYLREYDPAQLDRPANFVPKPKEWTSIRKTFGNWKFGSMGKYFGDTFVSFGGIWYETGNKDMPYVVLEPTRRESAFLNFRSHFKWENGKETNQRHKFSMVMWLIFPDGLPPGHVSIDDTLTTSYIGYYVPLEEKTFCIKKEPYKGCAYPKLIDEFISDDIAKIASSKHGRNKQKKLWLRYYDKKSKKSKLIATISVADWAAIVKYNSKMTKFARIEGEEGNTSNKYRSTQNLRQCVLEYERLLYKDYDPLKNGYRIPDFSPEYLDLALKQIKKNYEDGDRECAFIYGYIFTSSETSHYVFQKKLIDYRDALKLVLEGIQQDPTQFYRKFVSGVLDSKNIFSKLSSTEIFDLAKHSYLLSASTEVLKRIARRKRGLELVRFAEKASGACLDLKDKKNLTAALNCYQEFTDLFPNKLEHIEAPYSQVKQLVACGPAKKIWEFLQYSNNIESLKKFIAKHSKCGVAQSAKLRLKEITPLEL